MCETVVKRQALEIGHALQLLCERPR